MSEIINRNGTEYKIGTCENLYYTTYKEFAQAYNAGELKKVSGNDEPINYMKGEYRFRFPFPDESRRFGEYSDFDKGVMFMIPKTEGIEIAHGSSFYRTDNTVKNAPAVGFNWPCVQASDFPAKKCDWSDTARYTIFEIVQQKPVNGKLQVVVRCPYCRESCRLDDKEVKSLVTYVWKNRKAFTREQVLTAIYAAKGYKVKLSV